MLGRWIDGLGDVERDRVIEAQGWTAAGWFDGSGDRCVAAHALGIQGNADFEVMGNDEFECAEAIGVHYDSLCRRHGKDNVVRWVKARAARGVTSRVVEIAPEAVAGGAS